MLEHAARGSFPPADGTVEILPAPPGPAMGVVALTGRHLIATAAPEEWVRGRLASGDLLAPMSPRFLAALGEQLGRRDDGVDVLLAAPGLPGTAQLEPVSAGEHPRVTRALAHRGEVRAFDAAAGAATVVVGLGLAGRLEVAVEVEAARRGQGLAARSLAEARRLVGSHEVLFAQAAPGNAASLRALLSAGFRPIGSEVLFFA